MLLVLSITFVIKIYGVVCVQLTHFSSGDWKDIFIAYLYLYHIFRGLVSEMFVTSYSVTYCIYIPGKLGFCSQHYCAVMMSANIRIRYGLQIVFVCLYITPSHYHNCENLSVDIDLMKCLPDIFCRVHRSTIPNSVTPTASSCIDNSWRSTTLPKADSASSNQTLPFENEHEWVLEKLR